MDTLSEKQLLTKIKHLENELRITKEENEAASKDFFDLFSNLENEVKKRTKQLTNARKTLKGKNAELQKALTNAETASKAKSEFLANISHELRTPLNAIIGFSELLKEKNNDEEDASFINSINTAGKNLLLLINNIIEINLIESGKVDLSKTEVDVAKLFKEILTFFATKIEEKGISVDTREVHVDNLIFINEHHLRHILTNIISNAVKYTSKGTITVAAHFLPTKKSAFPNLEIKIKDTGVGIKEGHLPTVFEAFSSIEGSKSNKGLRLAICKKLTELINGEISVESVENEGSEFTLCIKNVEISSAVGPSILKKEITQVETSEKAFLLVDDNEQNIFVLEKFLQDTCAFMEHAENGEIALEKIAEIHPNLVLMDINMPVMSGIEAAKTIRENKTYDDIKLVALTAMDTAQERTRCKEAGFDAFISKPIDRSVLLDTIRTLCPIRSFDNEVKDKKTKLTANQKSFLERIEKNHIKKLNEMKEVMVLSEIEQFTHDLYNEAKKLKITPIINLLKDIELYAQQFQIEELTQSIESFPHLINNIQN